MSELERGVYRTVLYLAEWCLYRRTPRFAWWNVYSEKVVNLLIKYTKVQWSMFTWNLDMSRLSGLSFLLWIQRNLKLWLLIPARWIISDATLFAVICHFHPAEPLGPLPTSGYNLKAPLRPFIQHRLDPTPISLDPTPSPPDPSLPRKVFLAEIVVTADCIVVVSHPDKSYQMKAHHRVV